MGNMLKITVAGLALLTIALMGSYCSFSNEAGRVEESVKAQWKENQNAYDAMWKTIAESAQVPAKYKEDFKEILMADTQGKYGKSGAKSMILLSNDRQISLDSKTYDRLMRIIEANRADFRNQQTSLADKQRAYANLIHNTNNGRVWSGIAGFPRPVAGVYAPKEDLDGDDLLTVLDYPIVTSKRTKAAFATGEDEELDVFGGK